MTAPTLTHGAFYRILTRNGRQWDRVQFDARRLGFLTSGNQHGEPKLVSLDCVERIAPLASYHDRHGGPWCDVGAWMVQESAA